jgi:hypothetical protein
MLKIFNTKLRIIAVSALAGSLTLVAGSFIFIPLISGKADNVSNDINDNEIIWDQYDAEGTRAVESYDDAFLTYSDGGTKKYGQDLSPS